MKQYKNKTLYVLIPIKAALFFFLSRVGSYIFVFAFCCFSIKELILCHLSLDSFIVFYIYTIIYLSLVWNFLLNINAILKKVENQTVAGPKWLP